MTTQADLSVIEIKTVQGNGYYVTVNGRHWGRYDEYEQAVRCCAVLVRAAIRKLEAR